MPVDARRRIGEDACIMIALDSTELIAIGRFTAHIAMIRRLKDGRALPFRPDRGRPNKVTGITRRDARLVCWIDMQRVLRVFDARTLLWATCHFADGRSVPSLAHEAELPQQLVESNLRGFAAILTDRLLDANLL